ncbi:MAG TPA: TerC family protein [Casimicrobiaceae bacterium]|nr:TerC family protein [Casimicrobiaceae bacterium]
MIDLFATQFWVAVAEIILINILLSGDNAVVIALACRNLPLKQRRQGIFWGVVGAIVLRIALTFFAMSLLVLPYLKLLGGVLLVWIGIKLIAQEEREEHRVKASKRLLTAIWTIIVADLVMSLDNVMAVAAAAKGHAVLMVFGLAVSIPIVIIGSQLIMRSMERYPLVILAGGGLLGYIAGDMAIEDPVVEPWLVENAAHVANLIPLASLVLVIAVGSWLTRRRARTAGG